MRTPPSSDGLWHSAEKWGQTANFAPTSGPAKEVSEAKLASVPFFQKMNLAGPATSSASLRLVHGLKKEAAWRRNFCGAQRGCCVNTLFFAEAGPLFYTGHSVPTRLLRVCTLGTGPEVVSSGTEPRIACVRLMDATPERIFFAIRRARDPRGAVITDVRTVVHQ